MGFYCETNTYINQLTICWMIKKTWIFEINWNRKANCAFNFAGQFCSAKCNSINSNVTHRKISPPSPKSIDLSHMLVLIHRWWDEMKYFLWVLTLLTELHQNIHEKLNFNDATLHWRSGLDVCFLHLPVLVFMALSWVEDVTYSTIELFKTASTIHIWSWRQRNKRARKIPGNTRGPDTF